MPTMKKHLSALALGLAVVAAASPGYARAAVHDARNSRAAAIHECSQRAAAYTEHTWGNMDSDQYRACMAEHGQPE